MKISFGTRLLSTTNISGANGYGYATQGMLASLDSLGYQVEENDASADVEIWFDQPHWWNFSDGPYKIGYHPWESTELLPGWADIMNKVDEIWTPSPLIADWYKTYAGVKVPIYVYEHGVEHIWKPQKREVEDQIKFLHVGGETRKGAWDSVTAFNRAFTNGENVSLTLKTVGCDWNKIPRIGRVNFIDGRYSFDQLQDLFYSHHIYSYPSAGEGFGLTPLQALASGMPTVTVADWAPYAEFLDDDLSIPSTLESTKWPDIHPGKMFKPNFDEFIDRLHYAAENFETLSQNAYDLAPQIHKRYDWDTITGKMFTDLEKRLENR